MNDEGEIETLSSAELSTAVIHDATNTTQEAHGVLDPLDSDVLSGRGAKVNARPGNQKFRALCFAQKTLFEAGNHAAKRRIATDIVLAMKETHHARFFKRKGEDSPWFEMTMEQSIQKACQVLRDYKRPDREAIREAANKNGMARKRDRKIDSTPMDEITPLPTPNLFENPFGVHSHDILSGRGAFVNGHVGNQRLRKLAMERKIAFDAGNFTEKQALATEIVGIIKSLDPPGRFLKRAQAPRGAESDLDLKGTPGDWEELSDEKAVHKACQVMRDIDRPDRAERAAKTKRGKKDKKAWSDPAELTVPSSLNDISAAAQMIAEETASEAIKQAHHAEEETRHDAPKLEAMEENMGDSDMVHETVAAADAALDEALETTYV